MHVQVHTNHPESSFLSMSPETEHVNVVLVEEEEDDDEEEEEEEEDHRHNAQCRGMGRDTSNSSMCVRDTSNTCRDSSMDNTRQTVNTQTSILDLTKDEEEEEDDESDLVSVLFQELHETIPSRLLEDSDILDMVHIHVVEQQNQPDIEEQKQDHSIVFDIVDDDTHKATSSSSSPSSTSLLGQFRLPRPDFFFDNICNSTINTSCANVSCTPRAPPSSATSCGAPGTSDTNTVVTSSTNTAAHYSNATFCTSPEQRLQLETDVWNLLGCASPPDGLELEFMWNLNLQGKSMAQPSPVQPKRPMRASLKDRMNRIHRLRQERWAGATRHGITLSSHNPPYRYSHYPRHRQNATGIIKHSVSMDYDDPLVSSRIGPGMDPILPGTSATTAAADNALFTIDAMDGYDSDPEFGLPSTLVQHEQSTPSPSSTSTSFMDEEPTGVDAKDKTIFQTVQQTLNSTWTLTWHPNPQNIKEYQIDAKPISVNMWMERGTVITHSGVVVEPMFMWRDAYQPHLWSQRKLNATSQKPWSIRLLNTCRISPCHNMSLDNNNNKNNYPLARRANCLMVKTCQGQEFLLEANSPKQATLICERWKLAVARFASLAVTEDIDAIAAEFFHPTLSRQTLTLPTAPSTDSTVDRH